MEIAVLTNQAKPVSGFDYCFYEVKQVTGKIREPARGMFNIITCFADNMAVKEHPDWIAVSEKGKALRSNQNLKLLWDWICPTNEKFVSKLLELVADVSRMGVLGIRLDCAQFAREGFCRCKRCMNIKKREESWDDLRVSIITDFVEQAAKVSKVPLMIGLEPDPAFSRERFGQDIDSLSKYADSFCVPIYMDYSIVYWCDIIAYAFRRNVRKKLVIDLYAGYPRKPIENLFKAIIAVANYADTILLSTFDYALGEYVINSLKGEKFYEIARQKECKPVLALLDRLI